MRNLFILGLIVFSVAYMFFILFNQYEDATVKQNEQNKVERK